MSTARVNIWVRFTIESYPASENVELQPQLKYEQSFKKIKKQSESTGVPQC